MFQTKHVYTFWGFAVRMLYKFSIATYFTWGQIKCLEKCLHSKHCFYSVQIKVTKNHVIPRFVVFSHHETVWGGFVLYKKVLFMVKYDIKMKKKEKS